MSAAAMPSVLSELTSLFTDDDAVKAHALAVLKCQNKRRGRPEIHVRTPFASVWDIHEGGFRRSEPGRNLSYYCDNTLSSVVPHSSASKDEVARWLVANGIALRKSWTRKQMIQAILKA